MEDLLEILIDLSSYIEVPEGSAAERRTFPTPAAEVINGTPVAPLNRIRSSRQTPGDVFAAVPYMYWIDDKDLACAHHRRSCRIKPRRSVDSFKSNQSLNVREVDSDV